MALATRMSRSCRLVAAAQKQDHVFSAAAEVDPVTGAVIDPQFADAVANRLHIAYQPCLNPDDPLGDAFLCPPVLEGAEPFREGFGLVDCQ
jgi:hypothetical protein